ncbi:hypothetical protein H7X46_17140 [Pseudonocardia sp. C8]|uniref:hypothetical protein n=1 Tax=Pseudonocardia sp. C8 TaxID=2762759 RepID=UPI001642409A|nr:hypothetical protein [Pseudonocardia sp. C8]MBC3192793.1 hypothetical protein [Pseudonocardia sp. C8]
MTARNRQVAGAVAAGVHWWGAALPRAGLIVVADPLLPPPLMTALLSDAMDGARTGHARGSGAPRLVLAAGTVGGFAAALLVAPDGVPALLLVLAAVGSAVWACRAENRAAAIRRREGARPLFAARACGGTTTWDLVAHLEVIGRHGDTHRAAARTLLWRIAHLGPAGDPAIARLAELARSGDLESGDELYRAAERLRDLPVAAPADVRRSVPQLSVLFRYETGERG